MKGHYSGILSISDDYPTAFGEMASAVVGLLGETLESPFVAVAIRSAGLDYDTAYVMHDEEMGQYKIAKRTDVQHIDEPYWSTRDKMPTQWLVKELLKHYKHTHHEFEVELVDIAVARHRVGSSGLRFERDNMEDLFGETEMTANNRAMAFSSISALPHFVSDLTTDPIYDKEIRVEERKGLPTERMP